LVRGEYLKGNQGSEDWLRLFKLISAEFARAEDCPEPPDVPARAERLREIRELDKRLQAAATLENLSHVVRWSDMTGSKRGKPTYYLIIYDNTTNEVGVEPYFAPKNAMEHYEIAELRDSKAGGDTANIVLVEADKMDLVREAYPNYFGDVQLFRKQLRYITQGKGARDFIVKPQETVRAPNRENIGFWELRKQISSGGYWRWGYRKH